MNYLDDEDVDQGTLTPLEKVGIAALVVVAVAVGVAVAAPRTTVTAIGGALVASGTRLLATGLGTNLPR